MGATEGATLGSVLGMWALAAGLIGCGALAVMGALVQGLTSSRRKLEAEIDAD